MKLISICLFVVLFLFACGGSGGGDSGTESNTLASTLPIDVFFSTPAKTMSNKDTNGPEVNLVNAINQAVFAIDMAIYELSLENITLSLIAAHQRNVQVRVVTDSDHLDWTSFEALRQAGITIKGDERSALMHNKFTVIDNKEVWTGSMNLTYFGAYRHHENLIRVASKQAAFNYTEEFEQLWAGIHNQENIESNYFMLENTPVEVYFSPDDKFRATRLLPLLEQATQSIHMMAFSFTSEEIATELLRLKAKGIEVKIVLDKLHAAQSSSQYDDLLVQQVDIRKDSNPYKLHHKVIIIDQRYVVTGSYNFSQNAETRNDENSIVIDSLAIAAQFETEFSEIYRAGESQ